ncbi:hypothetical protein HN51_011735 [Arachis hypogaea]|uniref:Protein kinase domain-containing protein n=1 Tax=Arachis hypogaea TaxID=3818 RepID=A0A445DXS4_ARAHY|nr:receptor-like protein kinase THESEUS 1 [Arachis hypogaea]QHO57084.1 putative receptor-like protein kinase [Arachis hypogaea]RYR67994.1 hypothetical protein Ahy_A03g014466 [Arachis hypogaea]
MATHELHIIQYSSLSALLLQLLQLSSFLFLSSLGCTPPDKYRINCGSHSNVLESGKIYTGDSNSLVNFSSTSKIETSQSSVSSPLYQTARIFPNQSWYDFPVKISGIYLLRLHFLAFKSPSNLPSATFSVSVHRFGLLQNFEAQNHTNSASVKEFFMNITAGSFRIIFTPQTDSFAFVNAIELFLLPRFLIANQVSRFNPQPSIGQDSLSTYSGVLSRVLETKYRLNIGGRVIPRGQDPLLRLWSSDETYLVNQKEVKLVAYLGNITFLVGKDSDGPNANYYTAPSVIYKTAREINDTFQNISWVLPVDRNVDHLVRVHFCDFWSIQCGLTIFGLYIYGQFTSFVNNDTLVSQQLPAPYYYDFLVHSDDSGFMRISVEPQQSSLVVRAFLSGLEIMVMGNDSTDFRPLTNQSNGNHHSLLLVLGSVIGCLMLIFVVVLGLVWHLKIRKQRPSDVLSIPTIVGEGSPNRTSERNVNLGLKISLHDIQLATENFDEKQIIGTGGFGNVYLGVLRNGTRVAVKRSKSESSQGLLQFETEIMVLSKIRHRNLVSLIGYCEENSEMILVYEYMENGALRDHLYDTKLPSLCWKQRLEICIGAAKGLHYLHEGAPGGIIHRDVKSTNILLDENHVAQVSDFGISKTAPLDHQTHVSTNVKGTFGYLDPEYFKTEKLTEKCDVYSFGVVLLEVLCARPTIDQSLPREQMNLADWGILCKRKGMLQAIIDPSIKDQIDQNSLEKFSDIVGKCLQEYGSNRPTMGEVLRSLKYALHFHEASIHEDGSSNESVNNNAAKAF